MIRNVTKNKVLARKAGFRSNFLSQGIGLMLRKKYDFIDRGLIFIFYIENIKHIHTFFMLFNIDILFLDKNKRVSKIYRNVRPWRLNIAGKGRYVVELVAGNVKNTEVGDRISFK